MWLFTPFGFFSVVQKEGDAETHSLTIRARVAADLEGLRDRYLPELGDIYCGEGSDYQFRAKAPKSAWSLALLRMGEDIDYSNFKDEVASRQGQGRAQLYHEVWGTLAALPHIELNASYGAVLIDDAMNLLLRKPKGEFDGYVWTLPKGRQQPYETAIDTLTRVLIEKTASAGTVLTRIPGQFRGGHSTCEYFLMRCIRKAGDRDACDSQELLWIPFQKAGNYILKSQNEAGRKRDLAVLDAAMPLVEVERSKLISGEPPSLDRLFDTEPEQWGLRGDRYLWLDLKKHLAVVAIPASAAEFLALLQSLYLMLTGHSISETAEFYVGKYSHGGMSSGGIYPQFWRNAFRELAARFDETYRKR